MNAKAAALALAASLAVVSAASAETQMATKSVSVARVDFSQPAQVQALYGRLNAAARQVCRTTVATATAQAQTDAQACREAALDSAVKQINRSQLSLAHRAPSSFALASR